MGSYHGKDGVVKVGVNAVAEVKQFSIQTTAKVADDTVMGDEWETHIPGKSVKSWSGSMGCNFDPGDLQGQALLVEGASIALKLFPIGAADGVKYLEGTATITQVSIEPNKDAAVPATYTFQGNGTLTRSTFDAE